MINQLDKEELFTISKSKLTYDELMTAPNYKPSVEACLGVVDIVDGIVTCTICGPDKL